MRLFQVLEMRRVWDVAALFWFAVAFAVGVAGAGGDLAGAGAFLDDVVDHDAVSLSLSRTLPLLFEGVPYASIVSHVRRWRLLGRYLFPIIVLLHPVGESRVRPLVGCPVFVIVRVFSGG